MANSFPFPFLQLPGETRNQIYSNLIDNGQLRDGEEEGLVDTWRIFGDGTHKRGMTCSGLVTLMRTCRAIYKEASAYLYHRLKFRLSPQTAHANLSFLLNGPGRHLRSVVLQFRAIHQTPVNSTEDGVEHSDSLTYEERVIWALAARARKLEHLEIQTEAKYRVPLPKVLILARFGVLIDFPEYSYMEPPLCLPGLAPGEIPQNYTEEQLVTVLEYMAPGDGEKQSALRHMMINFVRPSHRAFWTLVRRELRAVEAQKVFWGHRMMEALGSLSPTLRTVDRVGVVDEQWMVAVADLLNVRVRSRLVDGLKDWIVVDPSSQEGKIDQ